MLTARDHQVVELVGWFGQLSSAQIKAVLFPGVASPTPVTRSCARLLASNHLARVGRRTGAIVNGASPYVYQLGPEGWKSCRLPGAYQRSTAVNEHSLGIADVYVSLIEADRAGTLKLLGFELEQTVGDVRADVWAEIGIVGQGQKVEYFLEVDLGSERPIRIEEKCAGYWRAYDAGVEVQRPYPVVTEEERNHWPYVAFIVPDERRAREVGRVLKNLPEERRELFRVLLSNELIDRLLAP